MRITFDPVKREKALAERGLDFVDAEVVFEGMTLEVEDIRKDVWGSANHLLRFTGGADGSHWVHTAWRGSSRIQHEESQ